MYHQVHCDVAVGVYLNGTIKNVHHTCIDDFILNECRTHPSPSDDGTFYSESSNCFLEGNYLSIPLPAAYYACCNDRDYCNK
jgi:hypothetical protein